MSDPIDTRGVLVALGADPNDCDRPDERSRTQAMTQPSDTTNDTAAEPLWMACRPGGDVMVQWEDLTVEEQQDAHRHHNQLYGIETWLHAAPHVKPGRVIVVEDGEVVADGRLADLVRTDGDEAIDTDIYVHPDDVKALRERWFECKESSKERLN